TRSSLDGARTLLIAADHADPVRDHAEVVHPRPLPRLEDAGQRFRIRPLRSIEVAHPDLEAGLCREESRQAVPIASLAGAIHKALQPAPGLGELARVAEQSGGTAVRGAA